MLKSLFTEHPASVDETYTEHMAAATSFSVRMLLGGIACFIHAFLPFLFVKTGSSIIEGLNDRMVVNRRRHEPGRLADRAEMKATQ
jgi:hypothetical protein